MRGGGGGCSIAAAAAAAAAAHRFLLVDSSPGNSSEKGGREGCIPAPPCVLLDQRGRKVRRWKKASLYHHIYPLGGGGGRKFHAYPPFPRGRHQSTRYA